MLGSGVLKVLFMRFCKDQPREAESLVLACMHAVKVHCWSCQLTLTMLTPALLEKSLLGVNSCHQILLGVASCGPAPGRLHKLINYLINFLDAKETLGVGTGGDRKRGWVVLLFGLP